MQEAGSIEDLLRLVRAHVVAKGHTRIYPVEWRPTGDRGFACQDCETSGQTFEVRVEASAIVTDPRTPTIFTRDAISAWLETTKVPPLTDFDRILRPEG